MIATLLVLISVTLVLLKVRVSCIERFHSRDYWPYWFTETKESICIKISSIPRGLVWDTNMAAISLFWDSNMAVVTSCENTP